MTGVLNTGWVMDVVCSHSSDKDQFWKMHQHALPRSWLSLPRTLVGIHFVLEAL